MVANFFFNLRNYFEYKLRNHEFYSLKIIVLFQPEIKFLAKNLMKMFSGYSTTVFVYSTK